MLVMFGLFMGCAPSASEWPATRAAAECDLYERCDLLVAFDSSTEQCQTQLEDQEAALLDSGCDYSAGAAGDCLDTYDTLTCDEFNGERPDPTAPCDLVCGGG
jgi:hypothetical protein